MRTRAALLIAAFAILVVAASAVVTSHFGMRDWPTPPLPDTATRLITPTEAAGRAGDRATSDGDGGSDTPTVIVRTTRTAPAGRRARGDRRRSTESRRAATRGSDRGTRRSGGRGSDGDKNSPVAPVPDDATVEGTPEAGIAPAPAAPAPGAPITESGPDGQSQARPNEPVAPLPAVPAVPAVPQPAPGPVTGGESGTGGRNGNGRGSRRGPVRDLLDALL